MAATITRLFLRQQQRHRRKSRWLPRAPTSGGLSSTSVLGNKNINQFTSYGRCYGVGYGSVRCCFRSLSTTTTKNPQEEDQTSTSSSPNNDNNNKRRIVLTLYRQMIRWCNEIDENIPLKAYIPPLYMTPPQLNPMNLRKVALEFSNNSNNKNNIFPKRTEIDENHLQCIIENSKDAKKVLRNIFRINSDLESSSSSTIEKKTEELQKMRISLAFDGIKSLNELHSTVLNDLKIKRSNHLDRTNVKFHIGQVVRHKEDGYRGVIVGWTRIDDDDGTEDNNATATSLTSKSYSSELDVEDQIKYTVILDVGDTHLYHSKIFRSNSNNSHIGTTEIFQSDVEIVNDTSLRRIRNNQIPEYFELYDPTNLNMFIPNDVLAYEYPIDYTLIMEEKQQPKHNNDGSEVELEQAAESTINGIQQLADNITTIILGYTSAPEARKLKLIEFFLQRMKELDRGDVVLAKDRLMLPVDEMPKSKLAALHVQQLLNFVLEVHDLLRQRSTNTQQQGTNNIQFALGDIVLHKHFGFRGVIVGWDPKPRFDVSRWDGLQHIDNPEQYPFYHVIPDYNDCIEAFGSERSSRYVCEANLEPCPNDRISNLAVDMDPHWTFNYKDKQYIPPDDLKFKHGQDLEDDGITEQCLKEIRVFFTRLLVSIRDGTSSGDVVLDDLSRTLSSENFLLLLKYSDSLETATTLAEFLKAMWKAHLDVDIREKMDQANHLMLVGDTEEALALFTEIVDDDPSYADAWNRASTCEFMLGNLDASLAAAKRTVEIIPTQFQALNGMGLVYSELKELPSAVASFQEGLAIDPWSPVSSRLSSSIETLKLSEKLSGTTTSDE